MVRPASRRANVGQEDQLGTLIRTTGESDKRSVIDGLTYRVPVDVSFCVDPGRSWAETERLARLADQLGLSRLYVVDHFMRFGQGAEVIAGPVAEAWTTATAVAMCTSRIGIGTLVLGNSYRHPAVVANMAATLDQVSAGRLVLGLGAGWQQNEHLAYGIPLAPPRLRLDRHEEAVQVIRLLLTQEESSFAGQHYTLARARCDPRPLQARLPILLGGSGERRSIPMAARLADEWHSWADPELFRHRTGILDHHLELAGRDPGEVRRLTGQVVRVVDAAPDPDPDDIIGPADHVIERLAAYQAAGVDEMILRDRAALPVSHACDGLSRLASDVLPAFHLGM